MENLSNSRCSKCPLLTPLDYKHNQPEGTHLPLPVWKKAQILLKAWDFWKISHSVNWEEKDDFSEKQDFSSKKKRRLIAVSFWKLNPWRIMKWNRQKVKNSAENNVLILGRRGKRKMTSQIMIYIIYLAWFYSHSFSGILGMRFIRSPVSPVRLYLTAHFAGFSASSFPSIRIRKCQSPMWQIDAEWLWWMIGINDWDERSEWMIFFYIMEW